MITYRKTKTGDWVAYGPASHIMPRATITVTKKDGTTKQETITSIGKTFVVNGQSMVYGYLAPTAKPTPTKSRTSGRLGGTLCDECGTARGYHERRDSSGIPGLVCNRCNTSADYELSFA